MRLPAFNLHQPTSLHEALDLLARYDDDCQVYMGGTELLLVMKLGYSSPGHLVDCKRVPELAGINVDGSTEWSIGAGTTHSALCGSAKVQQLLPVVASMERQIANVRVRNAGTLGGNLCFAEPHSDPATLFAVLGAEVELISAGGTRRVLLEDFILGPLYTVLQPAELMSRVVLRAHADDTAVRFRRLAFKERPVVNMAYVHTSANMNSLVVGAVGGRPQRLHRAQELLDAGETDAARVAEAAMSEVEPLEDLEGSVEYKRHLVGVMTRRILASDG